MLGTAQGIELSRHSPCLVALIVKLLKIIAVCCIRSKEDPNLFSGLPSRKVSAPFQGVFNFPYENFLFLHRDS